MITCPNCQTANRPGAKFCMKCASPLPQSSPATHPLKSTIPLGENNQPDPPPAPSALAGSPEMGEVQKPVNRTNTRPLEAAVEFGPRPAGAIFGDRFLYEQLIFSDSQQNRYLVNQSPALEGQRYRACPNPVCGAIYTPQLEFGGKFCTACHTELGSFAPVLVLTESISPFPANLAQIARLGLQHGNVRPPLAFFQEVVAGIPRYCMLAAQVNQGQVRPDSPRALQAGLDLLYGLEYLHLNGVSFDGRVGDACLGAENNHLVWANFANASLYTEISDASVRSDLAALARLIYTWLTGKPLYEYDANLHPKVSAVFEQALVGPGYTWAQDMAVALNEAVQASKSSVNIDYRSGRRTSVGMVRSLNEDSLMVLETSRILQSACHPLGVYVVADGMGGHAAGEVASGTIVSTIAQKAAVELADLHYKTGGGQDLQQWVRSAVEAANQNVYDLRKTAGSDMGSTMVMVALAGSQAVVTHVGDSRVYLVNSSGISQVTTDHSLVERLVATGQIRREEARYHPQRNVVYRTVGDKPAVEMDISMLSLSPGEALLLCSDGLSGMLEDQHILEIIQNAASPQAACDALIAAANEAGGEDNISAILVQVVQL